MILIFICLIFLLLTIFWYLLIRNVIFEDFLEDNETPVVLTNQVGQGGLDYDDDASLSEETVSDEIFDDTYICLMNNQQYLNITADYQLKLGKKSSNSIFKVIDLPDTPLIQLESNKYPGYLLYYESKPGFRTGHFAQQSNHTKFHPLHWMNDEIILTTGDQKYVLTNVNQTDKLSFQPFRPNRINQTQLFTTSKIGGAPLPL